MKKILNFLIVRRPELQGKWWHRLANVLIYGSTIIILFFAIFTSLLIYSFIDHSFVYSFENDYSNFSGPEQSCYFETVSYYPYYTIDCGNLVSSDDFMSKYAQTNKAASDGKQLMLDGVEYKGETLHSSQILTGRINGGYLDNISTKEISAVDYLQSFEAIIYILVITIVWFIFWESIIYRALIYIIYGKRKL
jgi:hypothetical protein